MGCREREAELKYPCGKDDAGRNGKSNEFHEKREACIRKKYNADEIGQRVLNGGGGGWIKEPYNPEEMQEYIEVYATSVESPDTKDKRSKNARELYKYLKNNKEGLMPYDKQGEKYRLPRKA